MRESNFLIIRFLYGCDPSRLRGSDVEEVESPEAGRGVPRDASGLNAARHTGGVRDISHGGCWISRAAFA